MGRYVDETNPFEMESLKESDERPDKQQGLYRKFIVRRVDDPAGLGKHRDCEYFVLDMMHDKHARTALAAYIDACGAEFPNLAADLRERYAI